MLQQYTTKHLGIMSNYDASLTRTSRSALEWELEAASQSYESALCGMYSVASPTTTQYRGFGVAVNDPETRGKMILSYNIVAHGGSCRGLYPVIIGHDTAANASASDRFQLGVDTEKEYFIPPASAVTAETNGTHALSCQGALCVDTLPTVNSYKDFIVGLAVQTHSSALDLWFNIEARLHYQDVGIFQPGK